MLETNYSIVCLTVSESSPDSNESAITTLHNDCTVSVDHNDRNDPNWAPIAVQSVLLIVFNVLIANQQKSYFLTSLPIKSDLKVISLLFAFKRQNIFTLNTSNEYLVCIL